MKKILSLLKKKIDIKLYLSIVFLIVIVLFGIISYIYLSPNKTVNLNNSVEKELQKAYVEEDVQNISDNNINDNSLEQVTFEKTKDKKVETNFSKENTSQHIHRYSNWTNLNSQKHQQTCSCGDVKTAYHIWGSYIETTPATCTNSGVETAKCDICGAIITRNTPALGHLYGPYQLYRSPTCHSEGENRAYCIRCSSYTSSPIPPTGTHNYKVAATISCPILQQTQPLNKVNIVQCTSCGFCYCKGCGRTGFSPSDLHR